jgi:hypothetical protein
MQVTPTTFTAAEYCSQMERREIVVDRDYRWSSTAWPPAARSYLIDTILLGNSAARPSWISTLDHSESPARGRLRTWRHSAGPKADGSWDRPDELIGHDPNTLLTLCHNLGASNSAEVAAGLSGTSRVFLDLPVFRNDFAHRNEQTKKAAVDVATLNSVPANPRPSVILRSTPAGRYQSLLVEWLDDLIVAAEYLCDEPASRGLTRARRRLRLAPSRPV